MVWGCLTNGIGCISTGPVAQPPLVLLHGSSDSGMCWISVAQALQREYDIVMPDARGHGLSEKPESVRIRTMAADVAGLIHALGIAPVYLMGHSMGAALPPHLRRPILIGFRRGALRSALVG